MGRSIATTKPVVFTGAMRTSSDLGWDGPGNLGAAVRVASAESAREQGVMVVMSDRIFSALDVTKVHTSMLNAFDSPGLGPLGVIDDGEVIFRRSLPSDVAIMQPESPATPVDIVYAWAGADSRLLMASLESAKGVVVAGMGRGNIPPAMLEGIDAFIAAGKPVVVSSRTMRGRVGPTYGYPGAGRRLLERGAIMAGGRRPQQARIDLMLALGMGWSVHQIREIYESAL
jgi:L-asparaginase